MGASRIAKSEMTDAVMTMAAYLLLPMWCFPDGLKYRQLRTVRELFLE
jgi:hypothetical protein